VANGNNNITSMWGLSNNSRFLLLKQCRFSGTISLSCLGLLRDAANAAAARTSPLPLLLEALLGTTSPLPLALAIFTNVAFYLFIRIN
jgi:hypothetical protein